MEKLTKFEKMTGLSPVAPKNDPFINCGKIVMVDECEEKFFTIETENGCSGILPRTIIRFILQARMPLYVRRFKSHSEVWIPKEIQKIIRFKGDLPQISGESVVLPRYERADHDNWVSIHWPEKTEAGEWPESILIDNEFKRSPESGRLDVRRDVVKFQGYSKMLQKM